MMSKLLMAGKDDTGVNTAETEAVGENAVHAHVAAGVGDVVQVALGIRLRQVKGWRQGIVLQGQATNRDFDRSRRAERMGMKRLGGADGDLMGAGAESLLDGQR